MNMKIRVKRKLHPTGQLSIFAILIFQVLFIFFAMSLNIALVVHDKINLQNSVDLAAYYGAMKQAEMMNAIAHINYQIRQSWKLLSWRYRVLGSMGITDYDPSPWRPALPRDEAHILPTYYPETPAKPGPYFFCVAHKYWGGFIGNSFTPDRDFASDEDMMCINMEDTTPRLSIPRVTATLGWFGNTMRAISRSVSDANTFLNTQCRFYSYNSWLLGIMSFIHFRRDQSARKYMIKKLAETMAGEGPIGNHPHGTDLNGNSIADGVKKTFEKNLSFINKEAFDRGGPEQLKQFNSLWKAAPQEWLTDQEFLTSGFYSNFTVVGGGCERTLDYINTAPAVVSGQPLTNDLLERIGIHDSWPCNDPEKCNPSAGLKKRGNFIVFYSVKAELDYKNQIFLPFRRDIKLKAKAFAKPFGGRIGPDRSADLLLPRFDNSDPAAAQNEMESGITPFEFDNKYAPNYSRYPGDELGLRSKYVHHYWAKHIKNTPKTKKNIKNYIKTNYYPLDNDPLARRYTPPGLNALARKWEIAAVAPDLFDVTYFTILPYYMHTYFPKIISLLGTSAHYIRGDMGVYKHGVEFKKTSTILEQVGYHNSDPNKNIWKDIHHSSPPLSRLKEPFFYKIQNLALLLTGWNPPKKKYQRGDNDYEATLNKTNFAKCSTWVHSNSGPSINPNSLTTKGKIANGCIYGGRTGYSVKMISEDFLRGFSSTATNKFPEGDPDWYQP